MSSDLVHVSNAVSNANTGRDFIQDSCMTMWANVNWGELLSPAPISMAVLGSVCMLSSCTDDFCLVVNEVKGDSTSLVEWKHAKYPGSFKTCLQQMVLEGYTAFESAQKCMTIIQNRASGMPRNIQNAVNIVFNGSPQEVEAYVPDLILSVLDSAEVCRDAAERVERSFEGLTGLAEEIMLACSNKIGNTNHLLVHNNIHKELLHIQKGGGERIMKQRQETHDMFKGSFKKAEDEFHKAVQGMPGSWGIVGMTVVDSITQLAVSAGNAAISTFTFTSQLASERLRAFRSATSIDPKQRVQVPGAPVNSSPNGISTLPNDSSLTDPALLETPIVLQLATTLQQLVSGGEGGKPDWEKIRRRGESPSGADFVKRLLLSSKERLDTSKNISKRLDAYITSGLEIVITALEAGTAGARDAALEGQKEPARQLVLDLRMLNQTCNILLQQPGFAPKGPATPKPPSNTNSHSKRLAVENVKYKVDVTRASLEASRTAMEEATERTIDAQKKMTAAIADMTQMSMENVSLEKMLPVLIDAVTAFTLLRAHFSKITDFFVNVASLVQDVMAPSVSDWARALGNTTPVLAGVSLSDLAKEIIYIQMTIPLKVSMLCEKVASTYLRVSREYIMPAQRTVGQMIQFLDEAGRDALRRNLENEQQKLNTQAQDAAAGIVALVKSEQETFVRLIDTRLNGIVATVKPALPTVEQPSAPVKAITDAHIKDKRAYEVTFDMGDYF